MGDTKISRKCSHASEKITKIPKKIPKNSKNNQKNSEKVPWKKQKHPVTVPTLRKKSQKIQKIIRKNSQNN